MDTAKVDDTKTGMIAWFARNSVVMPIRKYWRIKLLNSPPPPLITWVKYITT